MLAVVAGLVGLAPGAAFAQTDPAQPESALAGDFLTVGVGGVYGPSYEGSDDYVFSATPLAMGRIGGIGINPRVGGLALDLIPDGAGDKLGFALGPIATYSGNRHRQTKDPVVRSAGKLKSAIDFGVSGGVTVNRVLHAYDSLTVSTDVKWNVNGAHRGMVTTPAVSYLTPLSRGVLVSLIATARHVDDDYARYYYSVSPAQAARSGLPRYAAKGGWTNLGVNMLGAFDLDGDVLNGGLALVGFGGYNRLLGDAKRTPYTSIRGDADQWLAGAGVAYTF